jgi:hypothetical protein
MTIVVILSYNQSPLNNRKYDSLALALEESFRHGFSAWLMADAFALNLQPFKFITRRIIEIPCLW